MRRVQQPIAAEDYWLMAPRIGSLAASIGDDRERPAIGHRCRGSAINNKRRKYPNDRCTGNREFGLQSGMPATFGNRLDVLGKFRAVRSEDDEFDRSGVCGENIVDVDLELDLLTRAQDYYGVR